MIDMDSFIGKCLSAVTKEELCGIFERAIQQFGIDFWAYSFESPKGHVVYGNFHESWADHYMKNEYYLIDALLDKSLPKLTPYQWSNYTQIAPLTIQQQEIFNQARDFGLYDGISIPIHESNQSFTHISLASQEGIKHVNEIVSNYHNQIYLLSLYFHMYVSGIKSNSSSLKLTDRERECLQWSAAGKLGHEIATILGLSNRSIVFHLENAKKKLNAKTIQQATALAFKHQIINF
jgi:DNA-binding CsgD family transcriptional regulator